MSKTNSELHAERKFNENIDVPLDTARTSDAAQRGYQGNNYGPQEAVAEHGSLKKQAKRHGFATEEEYVEAKSHGHNLRGPANTNAIAGTIVNDTGSHDMREAEYHRSEKEVLGHEI
eukprot:ANDGO_06666.mRNA.1 hypothetical protein